jgi:hypothetical protein
MIRRVGFLATFAAVLCDLRGEELLIAKPAKKNSKLAEEVIP